MIERRRMTTAPDLPDPRFEPMFTEIEAAAALRIKARSLRTERLAGRIGYQRVAGKIMYRRSNLIEWQKNQGVKPCPDQIKGRDSSLSRKEHALAPPITSAGPKADGRASVARAKASSNALKTSSVNGCLTKGKPGTPAPVVVPRP